MKKIEKNKILSDFVKNQENQATNPIGENLELNQMDSLFSIIDEFKWERIFPFDPNGMDQSKILSWRKENKSFLLNSPALMIKNYIGTITNHKFNLLRLFESKNKEFYYIPILKKLVFRGNLSSYHVICSDKMIKDFKSEFLKAYNRILGEIVEKIERIIESIHKIKTNTKGNSEANAMLSSSLDIASIKIYLNLTEVYRSRTNDWILLFNSEPYSVFFRYSYSAIGVSDKRIPNKIFFESFNYPNCMRISADFFNLYKESIIELLRKMIDYVNFFKISSIARFIYNNK